MFHIFMLRACLVGAFLIFCNSLDFWKNKNARSQAPAWERNCVGSSSFHLAGKRSFMYYSIQKRFPNILGNILKSLQANIMGSFPFPFEAGASQTIPFPSRSLGTSGFFTHPLFPSWEGNNEWVDGIMKNLETL